MFTTIFLTAIAAISGKYQDENMCFCNMGLIEVEPPKLMLRCSLTFPIPLLYLIYELLFVLK